VGAASAAAISGALDVVGVHGRRRLSVVVIVVLISYIYKVYLLTNLYLNSFDHCLVLQFQRSLGLKATLHSQISTFSYFIYRHRRKCYEFISETV